MTRKPNPKSNEFLNMKARNESEKKLISDFKSLAVQDEKDQIDLFAEAVNLVFKAHNWPPGNPQLTLTNYHVKAEAKVLCGYVGCKREAAGEGTYLPSKRVLPLCCFHFDVARGCRKVWANLQLKETNPIGDRK